MKLQQPQPLIWPVLRPICKFRFPTSKPSPKAGQLSEAHLHALTKEFFMNTRFDAASDRLITTNLPVKSATVMPPRWQNPDPAVRAAQPALDAAQAASKAQALPWKPSAPTVGNQQPIEWPLKRAGFAERETHK